MGRDQCAGGLGYGSGSGRESAHILAASKYWAAAIYLLALLSRIKLGTIWSGRKDFVSTEKTKQTVTFHQIEHPKVDLI